MSGEGERVLSAIVRAVRVKRKLRQEDLASLVGVTRPQIAYWESGSHGLSEASLERIAGALGMSVRDLLVEGLRLTKPAKVAEPPSDK